MSERELETEQNCYILTHTLLAITAFLSRSPWLLNRGPSLSECWFSLPHLISNWSGLQNWLNFLYTELYNRSTTTFFLWASQIALIQPIHNQGYTLLFLDRMDLLFTQVHFLFWQPGRVVGQYTTYLLSSVWHLTTWWWDASLIVCEMSYTTSFSLLPCPLWQGVLIPISVPSIG